MKRKLGAFSRLVPRRTKAAARARETGFTAERLAMLGEPQTVIDVGVASGTPALYEAFADSNLVLVEPLLAHHREAIAAIEKRYPKVFVVGHALGAEAAEREINVEPRAMLKSSMLERTRLTRVRAGSLKQPVRVERLDSVIRGLGLPGPFGLKLDTEGYELEVLRGAPFILRDAIFVIAEVSISRRFVGSYTFEELVGFMDEAGFGVTDLLDYFRPDPVGTRLVDLVFMPRSARPGR